jgi:hypothetical protein
MDRGKQKGGLMVVFRVRIVIGRRERFGVAMLR